MEVDTNKISRESDLKTVCITYREAVAEVRSKRCVVSIVGRVWRDDCGCESAVGIGFTDVCEDDCFEV